MRDKVRIKRCSETAKVPTRGSAKAAGWDLYADTERPTEVKPGETVMVLSGIAMEIPDGCFGAIYSRSGIATRRGLRLSNCVGVVDSDYRGNIGIPVHNDSAKIQTIAPHERIAQIVIQPYALVDLEVVDDLSETERGDSGFGSTGI